MIEKFKIILREEGLTGKDLCGMITGLTYDSYRSLTRKGVKIVPRWVRSFVIGYELGKMSRK